jgi:hypothetical protein
MEEDVGSVYIRKEPRIDSFAAAPSTPWLLKHVITSNPCNGIKHKYVYKSVYKELTHFFLFCRSKINHKAHESYALILENRAVENITDDGKEGIVLSKYGLNIFYIGSHFTIYIFFVLHACLCPKCFLVKSDTKEKKKDNTKFFTSVNNITEKLKNTACQ